MPSKICRAILFLSSFFPLFVIFAILSHKQSLYLTAIFLLIGILSLLALIGFLRFTTKKVNPETIQIVTSEQCGEESLNYILTYIFPFMFDFTSQSWEQLTCFAIFFIVLGYLFVSNNMIHINPMLNFFGYHLYEITTEEGGDTYCLVAKHGPRRRSKMEVVLIGEQIYIEKKADK